LQHTFGAGLPIRRGEFQKITTLAVEDPKISGFERQKQNSCLHRIFESQEEKNFKTVCLTFW